MKIKKLLAFIMAVVTLAVPGSVNSYASGTVADYEIKVGETITVSVPAYEKKDDYTYVKFVPEESGTYILKSHSSDTDPLCNLIDDNGEYLYYNDDIAEENYNFAMTYAFTAGETYWFCLADYAEDTTWNISLNVATHTAVDGSAHAVNYIKCKESTCTENGYTDGLYCDECKEFVCGHKKLEASHIDLDFNGVCDECITVLCSCICHSDSIFMRMIWSIINFVCDIFGLYHFCECMMIY